MRTKILLLLFVMSLLVSCNDDSSNPDAIACFDYSPKEDLKVGDEVSFINCSENAPSFLWDFKDGVISSFANPKHIFELAGEYDVMLIAANETSTDNIVRNIYISGGPNGFTYDDIFFTLGNFTICNNSGEGSSSIILSTLGISFNCTTSEWSEGTGDLVVFRVMDENITEGTYTMASGSEDNTVSGEFAIGWDPSMGNGDKWAEFTSGTLFVKLVNDKYELIFNFESLSGKISGHFLED